MQTLPISSIKIPPARQRSQADPKKFEELKQSILREGLFHAIILTAGNELVAGATRLKAIRELSLGSVQIQYDGQVVSLGQVPFTYTHKTDAVSLYRIELEENLRREQLSPIDEAMALAGLHQLLQTQAPEIIPGSGMRAPVTFKDTAVELGKITGESQTNDAQRISDSILVDKFKDHPDVKRAKTLSEAARLARKAAERQLREALGSMEKESVQSRHRILQGDCALVLTTVEQGTVDVIIADPPYGIGADNFGDQSKVGHEYKDDEESFFKVLWPIIDNASRICKPDAAMFIFIDISQFYRIQQMMANHKERLHFFTEWYIWPTPLIWHKPNRGHAPQPKRGPSRRYEAILYAVRGNREVRKVGTDVLTFNVPDDRSHGAGKPIELYKELLSWIVYPGDTVLDPCAGSGPIIPAAESLDCSAIAIEMDAGNITLIEEHLKKEEKKS